MKKNSYRKKRRISGLILSSLLCLALWAGFRIFDRPPVPDEENFVPAKVVYVIDGDTAAVKPEGQTEEIRLRFIGIDCPESADKDETRNTPEGAEAARRTKEILSGAGNKVFLEYDRERTDQYGRTLAYVWIPDGSGGYACVEELLLSEGMCRTMRIEPNSKYASLFEKAEQSAKEKKAGFWGTGFYQ